MHAAAKSHQSCPTLCNPIDGSPPGSPVPGILQARTLEWVAISWHCGSEVKVSACNVGDLGSIPGLGRSPREENGNPTPLFLPGESHGWRSLVGYSPRVRKESDMTERLKFQLSCTRLIKESEILSDNPFLLKKSGRV